jgi:hypothetical protein
MWVALDGQGASVGHGAACRGLWGCWVGVACGLGRGEGVRRALRRRGGAPMEEADAACCGPQASRPGGIRCPNGGNVTGAAS